MFSAAYQSCISQLNGLVVLPNSCRLIFTTANSHAEVYVFHGYKGWDWLKWSHPFKQSHLILSTLGQNELWHVFLTRDTKVRFASLQIHVNSAVRNCKARLTGETRSLTQVGIRTLTALSTKEVPENSGEQHYSSEGRKCYLLFIIYYLCIY